MSLALPILILFLGSPARWIVGQSLPDIVVRIAPGPYYVGQSIRCDLFSKSDAARPQVQSPRVPDAEILPGRDDFDANAPRPGGKIDQEAGHRLATYWIVPHRPGILTIPAFRVSLGGQARSSPSKRISVRSLPATGRPSEFLGGVGPFDVKAEASPTGVRPGEEVRYQVRVSGPAARGSTRAPRLRGLGQGPLAPRVEAGPIRSEVEPPSRTFTYRVRAFVPGEFVLPPVVVAAFDPASGRYLSRASGGVKIRVLDVPRHDPEIVSDGDAPVGRKPGTEHALAPLGLVLSGIVLVALAGWTVRRASARRAPDRAVARLLARLVADLPTQQTPAAISRHVVDGLAGYLRLRIGRPCGALTPEEARIGVAEATGEDDLGSRAASLVALCDRALYAESDPCVEGLEDQAGPFFEELARVGELIRRRGSQAEGP